jgi:hypothetical protein
MAKNTRDDVARKKLNKKQQPLKAKPGGKKRPVVKPGGGRGTK